MAPGPDPLDEEIAKRLRDLPVPAIADTKHDGVAVLSPDVAAVHPECSFVGVARTTRLDPDGLWVPLRALEVAREGDVIVVDADDEISEAVWGALLSTYADRIDAAGTVTNGAVRDVAEIHERSYPVFARTHTPRGPSGDAEEAVDVTVTVGGVAIDPGDVLVGSRDGVATLRRGDVAEIADAAAEIVATERDAERRIRRGEDVRQSFEGAGMI